MGAKLILNMAYCPKCEQVLVSTHRHDWRECEGQHGFVDGGREYIHSGGDIINLAVVLEGGKLVLWSAETARQLRNRVHATSYSPLGG